VQYSVLYVLSTMQSGQDHKIIRHERRTAKENAFRFLFQENKTIKEK